MKLKIAIAALYISIIVIFSTAVLALVGPLLYWNSLPSKPLNIWIVDKTVPVPDYREHKGIMWVLNHNKVVSAKTGKSFKYSQDFFGFFPINKDTYDIKSIPAKDENPDLIYLTDTYGVYNDDYLVRNVKGTRSGLIYGGLQTDEMDILKENLHNENTIIGEFNVAASPTNKDNRSELENIFGIHWKGWKGRYFRDLKKNREVPEWMTQTYEKQEGKMWKFTGEGYVLISDDDRIVVLESGTDTNKNGLELIYSEAAKKEFGITEDIPYYYWFEYTEKYSETEELAHYKFDLTETGKTKLRKLGLSEDFPAIVRYKGAQYNSYYFSGDFADMQRIGNTWSFYGLDRIRKNFTVNSKGSTDYFFWKAYSPMMKKIIGDIEKIHDSRKIDAGRIKSTPYKQNGLNFMAKVEGKDMMVYENNKWIKKFLRGVNIGAGKPGAFPGELAITKEEYLRWFRYIGEMDADVIRVYTTMNPVFYDALKSYNYTAKKPLYLLQGVWLEEEAINRLGDANAQNEYIKKAFIKDSKDLVDIFHGNANLPFRYGFASGKYKSDISEYVMGWVLGIEWDPYFVLGTNTNSPKRNHYAGKYLRTESASPFEAFLAEVGDQVLTYEADKYKMIRPVSYTNWVTTDILNHPNEPLKKEDLVSVNTEHIKAQPGNNAGIFASYHIYPYYPDFLNYEKKYTTFKDENGKIDSYKAYLRDLMTQHTCPVLVAEFGVPASRGMTHINTTMGFNQGGNDETVQGKIDGILLKDIYNEGYCGGLVFTWQDEWFKRTWNNMDLDIADSRPYWSNAQTNEQEFGIMGFDPGLDKSKVYVDGDISEWENETPISKNNGVELFSMSDEKYLYLMAKTKTFGNGQDELMIPIDTIGVQGNSTLHGSGVSFEKPADFLLDIKKNGESRILVDQYYDSFNYIYGIQLKMLKIDKTWNVKNTGIFNPMYLCLNRKLFLPVDKKTLPFSKYETGKLVLGDGNPEHSGYNSMTDYAVKNGNVEIRIPWQLLNVMDPSTKRIMGDLYSNKGITPEKAGEFYLGAFLANNGKSGNPYISMGKYDWKEWKMPSYHERLKPSYYILKDAFAKYN